jgi:DNA-binding transcriptional LysR family regulator
VELDQLRTFLAVIEHAGFTRAAEALGLSQSTVSFQIKSLEADAGARLLDRGPGGVVPTPAGRVLRRHAERVLEVIAEAKAALSAESEGAHGHVIVAASTIPGEYLLPPVLALLRRTHPGVSITIDVGDSGSAIAALLAGRCDLALVGTRPADRRIATRPFADDEVVLVGAPGADGVDATDPEVLRTVSLVLRKETSGTRAAVADLLARHPPAGARVVVGSTEAAKRCAAEGLGLAFVSRCAVADELENGRLALVALRGLPVRRRFWLATSRRVTASASAAALVELLSGEGDPGAD